MTAESAIAAFDDRRGAFLDDLFTFLRFETVSTDPDRADTLRECAEWIRQQLASADLEAEILETAGHPVVFADSGPMPDGNDAPTILVYGHYDVQPVGDASLWQSPAFEPTIRDGAIYARGSADDKGQVMTHLTAMRCWHATGELLPVRVKFLLEGEEETGSPNLPAFVRLHQDRLACDYVVLSDTSKLDRDTPAQAYATRGLVYKEITIVGPSRDLHSGQYGGTVANPANVLARIIAGLHDDEHRVTIPGFYDDVLPLSADERQRLAAHGLTDADLLAQTGSPAPAGEAGFTNTERYGARPTLDVNGIVGGFTGDGSATIIPTRARAKVSMRLVANQDPDRVSRSFDDAVRKACPPTVRLSIADHASCGAYVGPTDSPAMQAAQQALEQSYGRRPVLTREGGTLPILPMFKQVLNADSVMLGFTDPDCNLHSPNEFFRVSDYETGTRCVLRFLSLIAGQSR